MSTENTTYLNSNCMCVIVLRRVLFLWTHKATRVIVGCMPLHGNLLLRNIVGLAGD